MFKVQSITEAKQNIIKRVKDVSSKTKRVPLSEAMNKILAEDLVSKESIPHFNRSTVDGFAVKSNTVQHASSSIPVLLHLSGEVHMGTGTSLVVTDTTCVYVPTGGALPEGADAVVMIENTDELGEEIVINASVKPFENVLRTGSDIDVDDVVFQKNTLLDERKIGLLSALGFSSVSIKNIQAIIISTGDEIVDVTATPKVGQVRDINTFTIKHFVEKLGITVLDEVLVKDDLNAYKKAVEMGIKDCDLVITSGGSAVGTKDYTEQVLEAVDAELFAHGINIKPGKPTLLAMKDNTFILGLPGQPLSAYFVLQEMMDAYLTAIGHKGNQFGHFVGELTMNVHAAPGRTTYQLVRVEEDKVIPMFTKSGMISALAKADGFIKIESDTEGARANESVRVYLF